MDVLETELARLRRDATLSQSIEDVDKILEQLCGARESIAAGEILSHSLLHLSFDSIGVSRVFELPKAFG